MRDASSERASPHWRKFELTIIARNSAIAEACPAVRWRESTGWAPKSVDERNSSFVHSCLHVRRASRRGLGLDDYHPFPKPRVTQLRGSYATASIAYKYHLDQTSKVIKPPRHSVRQFMEAQHQILSPILLSEEIRLLVVGFCLGACWCSSDWLRY